MDTSSDEHIDQAVRALTRDFPAWNPSRVRAALDEFPSWVATRKRDLADGQLVGGLKNALVRASHEELRAALEVQARLEANLPADADWNPVYIYP